MNTSPLSTLSRRDFIKTTAAATVGSSVLLAGGNFAYAAGSDLLKVGLVGCGGRGTGAARDAVQSSPGVQITAMGDLFEDRLDESRKNLKEAIGDALQVTDANCFTGFDNYKGVLGSGIDMVILATPPGFRPIHFQAAVDAGKHVFMEKPIATDPTGVRSIIASGEAARQKNLSVIAGTLYRRQPSFVEAIKRIHDGMIGDLLGGEEYYMTGTLWLRERKPGMSDMEWQCRNWYYFTWLSGDHIVEQFVHNIDVIHWVFDANPAKALAMGGRLVRVDPQYGHIYDHFSVEYEFPNGARVEAKCRQMDGTAKRVTNRIIGTKGIADLHTDSSVITSHSGEVLYRHPERGNNAYVQEHTDLIASIRAGEPINEARQIAESTLTAIMGRESAYTGQEITWDEIAASNLNLLPDTFTFGS
ncbi:MAG TPA: Gfo/Idh/MocA family oxidoreductase, partial [Rhodothermales bacterium]|nr:Gfo/Idh/MocA family oxidoreductase [Rhodothermales bacterium]